MGIHVYIYIHLDCVERNKKPSRTGRAFLYIGLTGWSSHMVLTHGMEMELMTQQGNSVVLSHECGRSH